MLHRVSSNGTEIEDILMKSAKIFPFAFILISAAQAALAGGDECGRWVECPDDPALSSAEFRSYIYNNTYDVEPWKPEVEDKGEKESLLSVASATASLGATTGAGQVAQAQSIADGEKIPGDLTFEDMSISQVIFEAAPELSPAQIAEGIKAAEMYLKSVGYDETGTSRIYNDVDDLTDTTGR